MNISQRLKKTVFSILLLEYKMLFNLNVIAYLIGGETMNKDQINAANKNSLIFFIYERGKRSNYTLNVINFVN